MDWHKLRATAFENRPDAFLERSGTSGTLQSGAAAAIEMQRLTRMEVICSAVRVMAVSCKSRLWKLGVSLKRGWEFDLIIQSLWR